MWPITCQFSVYLDVSCEPIMLKNVSEHPHLGAHLLVGHRPYLSPLHSFMWFSPTPTLWFWCPMVSTKRKGFEMWMIWIWIQALAGRKIQNKGGPLISFLSGTWASLTCLLRLPWRWNATKCPEQCWAQGDDLGSTNSQHNSPYFSTEMSCWHPMWSPRMDQCQRWRC